jgi:RimJ/RimL family protein N-acetyltransferase
VHSKSHGEYRGPAYFFPDELPNADEAELLIDLSEVPESGPFAWLRTFAASWHPIAVVRAADGMLASVCHSARSTPGAAEAGVETVDEYRGRGFGSAAVIAWAAAVRRGGRVPLYSTSWVNTPSRALAMRLGLVAYAEDFHL